MRTARLPCFPLRNGPSDERRLRSDRDKPGDVYIYEEKEAARLRFGSIVKDLVCLGYKNTYRHEIQDNLISVDYEMEDVPDTFVSVRLMTSEIIKW